jgi:hypothetical protein
VLAAEVELPPAAVASVVAPEVEPPAPLLVVAPLEASEPEDLSALPHPRSRAAAKAK